MVKRAAGSVDWNLYYTPDEAAEVLTSNSGKTISKDYLRTLIRYGVFNPQKLGNINMYLRSEVDAYTVEERGDKLEHKRAVRASKGTVPNAKGKKQAADGGQKPTGVIV